MSTASNASNHVTPIRNVYATIAILAFILAPYRHAVNFPKGKQTVGELVAALLDGVTPLAITLLTIAVDALVVVYLTFIALYVLQFVVNVEADEADARKATPNFLTLKAVRAASGPNRFYFNVKWPQALAIVLFFHLVYLLFMGHIGR